MPFAPTQTTKNWDEVYSKVIRKAIEESGFNYECKKSGHQTGSFTKEIVENLKTAFLVVADITDMNSNVMWELGVRHSLSKRTIMIAREEMISAIPSDIKNYVVIPYKNDITDYDNFQMKIKQVLQKIDDDPERSDNPVFDFLRMEDLILGGIEKRKTLNKLSALLSELNYNLALTEVILAKNKNAPTVWISASKLITRAIEDITSTNYVSANESYIAQMMSLKNDIDILVSNNRERHLSDNDSDAIRNEVVKNSTEVIDSLKNAIKETSKILNSIKRGDFTACEPQIILLKEEYEKLLE